MRHLVHKAKSEHNLNLVLLSFLLLSITYVVHVAYQPRVTLYIQSF